MKKMLALLIVVPPVLFAALFGYILYRGPRMTQQHHFRDFQMVPPAPAAGTVGVEPAADRVPRGAQAAQLTNPLQRTPRELDAGRVYYRYYCVFCHGESGAGDGAVGRSYHPRPADLRAGKVAAYGDGQLLRAMLTGVGHEPVLERVVPPEHRWRLALFVRSLAQQASAPLPGGG